MAEIFGEYDVLVAGAGVTGVVASIAAARAGARSLLLEEGGVIGGMLTGGRLTKPTGPVEGGIYREMIDRTAALGGADASTRRSYWGAYTSIFDPELMQRVIIDMIEESGVEVLLHARVTDALRQDACVRGVEVVVKSGRKLILATTTVDATGDGDVAALAGAEFQLGRPADGLTQPITSYFRMINVDLGRLVDFLRANPQEFPDLVLPEAPPGDLGGFAFTLFVTGFEGLIRRARAEGFPWIIPKDHITIKTGLLPGEINVNVTRVHGNALDERVLSQAEIAIRKQAYCAFDFFRRYVPGFENALFLEVAPKIGIRETRRIIGDYLLTEEDVRASRRFPDSIGVSRCAIDIHEPGGEKGVMISVGDGYDIPYRCLLPRGLDGLLVAGRCISADHVAHASTRNTPACAITGQAAGLAAALAAKRAVSPRALGVDELQKILKDRGVPIHG